MKKIKMGNLLGHPITNTAQISLADQIYDALCTEIFAKRWKPGDKLPSLTEVAKHSGCSRMPAQQALERLVADGYIKNVPRSGLFLGDTLPENRRILGTIGILVRAQHATEQDVEFLGFEQLLIHRLMTEIENYNYKPQIVYAHKGDDLAEVQKNGSVFKDVKGIISLFTFPHDGRKPLQDGEVPIVFWCIPDHRCTPCVASDYELAIYQLTKTVISRNHTEITPVPCSLLRSYVADRYWNGYARAMRDAGLKPQKRFYRQCSEIPTRDSRQLKKLLSEVSTTTAYVCFSKPRAEEVITYLSNAGVKVPEQVSVVGANAPADPIYGELHLTGIGYSPENEIETCIRLLKVQMQGETTDVGTVMLTHFDVEGDTLTDKAV